MRLLDGVLLCGKNAKMSEEITPKRRLKMVGNEEEGRRQLGLKNAIP